MKKKYDIRDKKNRHIRPLFFKYVDGYKGYRSDYYIYREEDDEYIKQGVVKDYKSAQEMKKNNEKIQIERGRMSYKKYETSMDYLELCLNKFRTYNTKKEPKKLSDILISEEQLSGQVWYPQVNKIVEMVRETKKSMSAVWKADNNLTNRKKKNIVDEIRQECIDYVCSMKIGDKTMRYLISLIDSDSCADISRFMFGILFGKPNEEFFRLIEMSKEDVFGLREDENGDVQIYGFTYKRVALN